MTRPRKQQEQEFYTDLGKRKKGFLAELRYGRNAGGCH
jgi:hypothetical protein